MNPGISLPSIIILLLLSLLLYNNSNLLKQLLLIKFIIIIIYCFHIDHIIDGIKIRDVQCQQDFSNIKIFPEEPSKMNDSGFLQLQYPSLNSDVIHSLENMFWRCSQSHDDHWNDRHFHIP